MSISKEKTRIQTTVLRSTAEELKQIAKQHNRSVSNYVALLIQNDLAAKKKGQTDDK